MAHHTERQATRNRRFVKIRVGSGMRGLAGEDHIAAPMYAVSPSEGTVSRIGYVICHVN
jgi:hypothetical protein